MKGVVSKMVISIVQAGILFAAGIEDFKSKKINVAFIILMCITSILGLCLYDEWNLYEVVAGASVGLAMVGLSVIAKEQIGLGDGLIVTACGIYLGMMDCMALLCVASLILSAFSIVLLVSKKGSRTTKLPLVPALFVGYLVVGLL